jgi:hypothetical protein
MKKILIGLVAVVAIAAGGYFGFLYYAQSRATAEVEAAFERMRSAGAKASHGTVAYDLRKRTITIADISTETATQPPTTIKIAKLTASGLSQPEQGRVAADLLEASDIEVSFTLASGASQLQYTYRLPKFTASDCSAPSEVQQLPAGASTFDLYRFWLEQFSRVAAASVTIPTLSVGLKFNAPIQYSGDVSYAGMEFEGIKDGKVATSKMDKGIVAYAYTAPVAGKIEGTGTLANLVIHDFDATAAAALLDPTKRNDDKYYQLYRQISLDSYDLKFPSAVHVNFGRIALDDIAVQPSRMQLPALIAAMPQAGATTSPAQARDFLDKIAGLYEGLRVGNFEISGISIDTPQGPAKLATLHLNMDHGKSDFAVEGLDARTPQGPLKAGHLAIKAIDFSRFMRFSATLAPGQKPPAEQALVLFQLVQGAEVKDLVAPYPDKNGSLNVDSLNFGWGQFVGPMPTQTHLAAKMSVPISTGTTYTALLPLLAVGKTANIDADLGAGWTESSATFALDPVMIEIAGLGKAQARVVLANVPRALFAEPLKAAATAAQIDTGALELTLHDSGGVDLLVSQYARSQNVSRDAARSAILDAIKTNGAQAAGASADAAAAVAAIGRFVETPQQTLVIKLTPIGKLPAVQLFQLLKSDPMAALAQFKIEASTGL